jgi:hypothetical protein
MLLKLAHRALQNSKTLKFKSKMLIPIVLRKVKIILRFTPYKMVITSNFTTNYLHLKIPPQLELLKKMMIVKVLKVDILNRKIRKIRVSANKKLNFKI